MIKQFKWLWFVPVIVLTGYFIAWASIPAKINGRDAIFWCKGFIDTTGTEQGYAHTDGAIHVMSTTTLPVGAATSANQDTIIVSHGTKLDDIRTAVEGAIPAGTNNIGDVDIAVIVDTPEFFEDTSFTPADGTVKIDFNDQLGRNSTKGSISNEGAGDMTISFSTDGVAFGDAGSLRAGKTYSWENISVDSINTAAVDTTDYVASGI